MTVGTPGFVRERLTEAREARGLTKVALAEMIGLTPTAISQYEKGPQSPRPEIMDLIAERLNFPRSFFLRPVVRDEEAPIFWRSNASATQTARDRCHKRLRWLKELTAYVRCEFDLPQLRLPPVEVPPDFHDLDTDRIEEIAMECRRWWNFGEGPVPDLLLELENSGVITSKIHVSAEHLDAFSQWSDDFGVPYVVLGKDKASAVRSRFDAAHELAHLVLHRHVDRRRFNDSKDYKRLEAQAHRFASAFLLPAKSFADELWAPTLDSFHALKERWRVSIGVMITRCEEVGITDRHDESKRLWINYSRRGWRKREPLDDYLKPEAPRVLRRSLEMLVTEGIQTREQIMAELCLPAQEIEELASLPGGYLSSQTAEVKAFPTLKRPQPASAAGGDVVSLAEYSKHHGS